jgi:hypothetical protein
MNHPNTVPIGLDKFVDCIDARLEVLDRNIKHRINLMISQKHAMTGLDNGQIIQREGNHGSMILTPIIKMGENR